MENNIINGNTIFTNNVEINENLSVIGNVHINNKISPEYIFLDSANSTITCDKIKMINDIDIKSNEESIILNNEGLTINSLKNDFANNTVCYDADTNKITYSNNNEISVESSLSNMFIDFVKINCKKTFSIEISGVWNCISMSADSKYQTACQSSSNGRIFLSSDYGKTWIPNNNIDTIGSFDSVSISSTGQYQSVVQQDGYIYISSDYGIIWKSVSDVKNWLSISISSTGQYQTAVSSVDDPYLGGFIYTSSDYGNTWIKVLLNLDVPSFFYFVAVSSTGQYQTAVITAYSTPDKDYTSSILTSDDYGTTWKYNAFAINLVSNSMSGTGQYQIISDYGDVNYLSSDYGNTWSEIISLKDRWLYSTISYDGQYQAITSQSNLIYLSSDYGNTWNQITNEFIGYITSITMSADGKNLSLTCSTYKIYSSSDYGITWNDNNDSPIFKSIGNISISSSGQYQSSFITNDKIKEYVENNRNWTGISISLTGQYQSAVSSEGFIYVSSDYGKNWVEKIIMNTIINNVCVSSGGQYQIANSYYNIYNSNDFGNTWTLGALQLNGIQGVDMSASGQYQTLVDYLGDEYNGGKIYISSNFGKTWKGLENTNFKRWNYVSISASGKYQLAITETNYYTSTDFGNIWTEGTQLIGGFVYCSISSTGQYQYISGRKNDINYSSDYGKSWNKYDTALFNSNVYFEEVSSTSQFQALKSQNEIYEITIPSL